jgi:hypothetical protein
MEVMAMVTVIRGKIDKAAVTIVNDELCKLEKFW